ncbi:hypothetical protein ACQP1W_01100 [Spirillospora sp. CA-255316]
MVTGYRADFADRKLYALAMLCREVVQADRSVRVGLRDATPRLEVRSVIGAVVDVRVDEDGAEFVCRPSFGRHSTGDVPGAARVVLALLRECGGGPPPGGAAGGGLR